MLDFLSAFFASLIASWLILRLNFWHVSFSADSDLLGPQKFHEHVVPRIGGVSIALGLFCATMLSRYKYVVSFSDITLLLICSAPAFIIGLTEDVTKKIRPFLRLFFIAISATLVVYLMQAQIVKLDIPIVDNIFAAPAFGAIFTILAITGLTNAYNIIDGFNGLSSMVGIITLLAIAYMGFLFADPIIIYLALVMAGATLGFFFLNYPKGLIFMGDSGAYLIGFWIAALSVLLTYRHTEISPWFALLINAYPVVETLFSIYRRKIHHRKSVGQPDAMHLHSLVYRRIIGPHQKKSMKLLNSKTSPYMWALTILSVVPALLLWRSSCLLIIASGAFLYCYVVMYKLIVNFKAPKFLLLFK